MRLFPYPPRAGQLDLVELARDAFQRGGHVVVESGTGTGKTVAALSAAMAEAQRQGKRVLYLTRTNSQERQVIEEFRAIREAAGLPVSAVALQGRTHLCPLTRKDPEFGRATSEELATMCRDARKAVEDEREGKKPKHTPCGYARNTTPEAGASAVQWVRDNAPTAEELAEEVEARGLCPYLVTRGLVAEAQVIAAPYVYFFNPNLRRALLSWAGATEEDFLVVVDEAHNLPGFLRDVASASLSRRGLDLAAGEARRFGDVALPTGGSLTAFLAKVQDALEVVAEENVPDGEEDALLPYGALEVEVLSALTTTSRSFEAALKVMSEYGEGVREARRRDGRTPRSYVGSVADFLLAYRQADEESYVKLVVGGENPRLEVYCLDPGIMAEPLHRAGGSVHMSGTLHPLEEYRDSLGLPHDAPLEALPSPFPKGNRRVLVDRDVTTRYDDVRQDPAMWRRIAGKIRDLRAAAPVNAAVFFPSFDALRRVTKHLRDDDGAYVEEQGARQATLMDLVGDFKSQRGGALFSVMGGRISEGLDFPEGELELVVVVGMPYPRPTARERALRRFYDVRFGKGWEYAVHAPMARRVLQAVGRLIRTPEDRGVAVLLDRRAGALKDALPEMEADVDAAAEARRFLRGE